MASKSGAATKPAKADRVPSKTQLQRQMARTRESLAETVSEIKETVEQQVDAVKAGVTSVVNYREEFQKDPLVWSLGALSAGFALGYTVGYAHKNTKGRNKNQVTAFADTMIEQLSTMGKGVVMPALDEKISELFGFDFSRMLQEVGKKAAPEKKKKKKKRIGTGPTRSRVTKKSRSSAKKKV